MIRLCPYLQDANTTILHLVRVAGFEPATPWSQTRCATRLRYTRINTSMAYDDNYNLKLLYKLADGRSYNETKKSTCVKEFIISYPNVKSEFKLDGQLKQIKRNFKFK